MVVPQFHQNSSSGVPATPTSILMSDLFVIDETLNFLRQGKVYIDQYLHSMLLSFLGQFSIIYIDLIYYMRSIHKIDIFFKTWLFLRFIFSPL